MDKVQHGENKHRVFTHGLHHLRHLSTDSPVRYMMYSEAAAAFISLHSDNTVQFYEPDGHCRASTDHSVSIPFMGLTSTKLPGGRLVGWGPGPALALLDGKLHRLASALEPLDIRVCQAVCHSSTEVVTAGAGNVCVWAVMMHTMKCKVKILEGVSHSMFTQMAVAPPRYNRPHRAFAVSGRVVTVVDLDAGHVLEHKKNLCLRDITALVHCSQMDCLIIASKDLSIKVWSPYWELCMAFTGHQDVVNSMLYSPETAMLFSASQNCTVRCWDMKVGDEVQCVHTENPPLYIGGPAGKRVFSYCRQGVDFWTLGRLYTLHCKLRGDVRIPLKQILVPPRCAPYPSRALCVVGDNDVMLVAAETGAVLNSFTATERVLCAEYCMHREILLVLTEAGTVLQADALTNPATLMDEWRGKGAGPWRGEEECTASDDDKRSPPTPGPASCLALYSHVAEAQTALREWRRLQEERGHSHRNMAAIQDAAKNKFLVILGQIGGCISVLKLNNGKLLHRTPAHNGQRVTGMQTDPENSHLLTIGEDKTVLVWTVCPYSKECLSLHLSLHCGQPLLHLAVLGPRLALASRDPHSNATYSLMQYSFLSQSRTDHPPGKGHSGYFIGLCVCPEFGVFASASVDGTVCIWNQENRLIRTLHLSVEPECIAYSGDGGDLLLGIRGDLYRISCDTFLPHDYHIKYLCTMASEPVPDITHNKAMSSKHRATTEVNGKNIRGVSRDGVWRQDYEALQARNKDLASLLQGEVQCKRTKPASTQKTQKEAFDRYMKMIYGIPPNITIEEEDRKALQFRPKPRQEQPCSAPILVKGFFSEPKLAKRVDSETKKNQRNQQKPAPAQCNTLGCKPNSAVVERLWPDVGTEQTIPKEPFRLKDHWGWNAEESKEEKKKVKVVDYQDNTESLVSLLVEEEERLLPPQRVVMTSQNPSPRTPLEALSSRTPPRTLSPRMPPNPRTPTPPYSLPTPLPPQTSMPDMPGFLQQFVEEGWFKDIYPDHRCIPCMLSPEDLSVHLLGCLNNGNAMSKLKILAALQTLHRQRPLQNTDNVFKGLIDSVSKCVSSNMGPEERILISETLKLLVSLKPDSHDLTMMLLSLLAYKDLALQKTVLSLLKEMGVEEAEEWLWPELESWESETQEHPDTWKSLQGRADSWLQFWTTKYKEHSRCLFLQSSAETPFTVMMADILNHFCSVQKDGPVRPQYVAPEGRKDAVLLHTSYCSQPVHRLGENYCMARTRRPGVILPPVSNRPFLFGSTHVITLPLPRVSLSPFSIHLQYPKAIPQRHFILKSSYVEYYR